MQKLLEPNTVPPDGFRYTQAETRTTIRAPDYGNLFASVREHRLANHLPLTTYWEAEVEDQLCQQLPPGFCKHQDPGRDRNVFSRVTWEQVISGTQTLASWLSSGLQHVDQASADRRAAICAGCYFNVQISGACGACGHLQNLAARLTSGRKTSSDFWLKACSVCRCALQAKVWVPIESVASGMSDEMLNNYPDFCWQKKEVLELRKAKL
jgi:hypothetical protein